MRVVNKDTEQRLVEMINSIKGDTMGWRSVHLHFSELLPHYKSEYQTKIAVNVILDFVKNGEGAIFTCIDSDIVLVCKGVTKQLIDKMVFRMRYLFSDDPLAYTPEGEENKAFCTVRDMTIAHDKMLEIAKKKLLQLSKNELEKSSLVKKMPEDSQIRPLTPSRLASLEKDIMAADLSKVMRRQPICAVPRNKQFRRVFDEFYINIAHLRRLLMANVDFLSNRWLFKYMTQLLDGKMLDMLTRRPADFFDAPVSLNLNVDTLLSERFARFDEAIKPSIKVSIVIEVQIADVFADMSAFLVAREAVQKMGYRICLDGVTDKGFVQLDREELGIDLVKMHWNADLVSDVASPQNQKLAKAIERCGATRIILCRCDNLDAVEYGVAFGIGLFQGRYLDSIIDPDAKIVN